MNDGSPYPPGFIHATLGPYLEAARIERMRAVVARRTRRLTAVLDRLYDDHNVAACVRSADACGVQDLHLVRSEATRPPQLGRTTSMHVERWLSLTAHASLDEALAGLRATHRVAVTSLSGEAPVTALDEVPLDRPLVVVFGNERDGVPATLEADLRLVVPMRGFAQSLNVSVAFALVMERLRSRLERERPEAEWSLPESDKIALLDHWVERDVTHAPAILAELARRSITSAVDP